jgi:GTPase SAR1 family protein
MPCFVASYVILDTPGQIEIFTWSASGAIITDAIASSFPTVVAYVIDTPRTSSPSTFMSNMLYACSILYKTKLPFILVFNKTDVQKHDFALEWMNDFEEFQAALATHSSSRDAEGEPTYMSSLMNSMSLVLDEFYKNLKVKSFVEIYMFARTYAKTIVRPSAFQVIQERASRNLSPQLTAPERNMKSLIPFLNPFLSSDMITRYF